MKEYHIKSIEEYNEVSAYLKSLDHSKIICFRGELGAGKTCLVKNFCEHLQCTEVASSPTFSIVNEYINPEGTIYHFDLYRMNSIEEVIDIGIEEYLFSDSYCLIEWPEIIIGKLLNDYIDVSIQVQEDNSRKVLISRI